MPLEGSETPNTVSPNCGVRISNASPNFSDLEVLLGVTAEDPLAELAGGRLARELDRIISVRLHGDDRDVLPGNHARKTQAGLKILEFRHVGSADDRNRLRRKACGRRPSGIAVYPVRMDHPREIELVFAPQEEGGYHVYAPDLPGLHSQGDTLEEATANAQEALELYVRRPPRRRPLV